MAPTRICSVPDCGKKHYAFGWCAKHHRRWKKHGDPLNGGQGKLPAKMCRIPNCGRLVRNHRNGLCNAHYIRMRTYGDPLGGGTMVGEPMRYFKEEVVTYEGNECLPWPYAKNDQGYGQLYVAGTVKFVHRLSCEEANGPPPTPDHEASHSCGKGRLGCVTKAHLSWKTHSENMLDAFEHGTHNLIALHQKRRMARHEQKSPKEE